MAKYIDKSILDKIKKGSSSFRFIEQTGKLVDDLFKEAHAIFTTENTLSIDQAEPTKTEFKVDQLGGAVDVDYETGDFTIKGTIPSVATELLDEFFGKDGKPVTLTTGVNGINGVKYKVANGYSLTAKRKTATVMIETNDQSVAVLFMNVQMVATFKWGSVKTEPIGIELTGTVLANTETGFDDFYVLEK